MLLGVSPFPVPHPDHETVETGLEEYKKYVISTNWQSFEQSPTNDRKQDGSEK